MEEGVKVQDNLSKIAKKLGQRGGKKTAELHGKEHFSKAGKKGMEKRWKRRKEDESD